MLSLLPVVWCGVLLVVSVGWTRACVVAAGLLLCGLWMGDATPPLPPHCSHSTMVLVLVLVLLQEATGPPWA